MHAHHNKVVVHKRCTPGKPQDRILSKSIDEVGSKRFLVILRTELLTGNFSRSSPDWPIKELSNCECRRWPVSNDYW